MVTTTPRPIQIVKDFIEREGKDVYVTRGSTYDNKHNLAKSYIESVIQQYEGTSIGRQELYGEILMEIEDALWGRDLIDQHRITDRDVASEAMDSLTRTVIGVDPATTNKETSDFTGIVVAGMDKRKTAYILGDHSIKTTPQRWAEKVVQLYYLYNANSVIAESNQGGEMVRQIIKNVDNSIPVKLVHASKGKVARAEPISARYEQGRVYHLGNFNDLEDELVQFVPGEFTESPNRVDALVWALTELFGTVKKGKAGVWGRKWTENSKKAGILRKA